jgi:hypothetical protein
MSHSARELYQLGGYKLSQSQVYDWCQGHDVYPAEGETRSVVNRWLASRNARIRVVTHNFRGASESAKFSYVVVTDMRKLIDWTEPEVAFEESENSMDVKAQLGINNGDLEYVTVRKWMKTKSKERRLFKSLRTFNGSKLL